MEKSSKTLTANFVQTFQSELVLILITTISGIILARVLGPTGRGEYITVTIWGNLLIWYLNLNLYQTIIYYWKVLNDKKDDLFNTLFWASAILGLVAVIIGEVIIVPFILSDLDTKVVLASKIFLIGLIPGMTNNVIMGRLAAQEKFLLANIRRIVIPLFTTLIIILLYTINYLNAQNAIYTTFIVNFIVSVFTIIYAIRQGFFKYGKINFKLLYTIWYGFKAQGGTIAEATSGNATQMILSAMLPSASLGLYSTAQSSASPVSTISNALQKVSFPRMTGLKSLETQSETIKLWNKNLILNFSAAIPFALTLPILIPLIYGKNYVESIIPAVILVFFTILNGQSLILRNAINGFGKTWVNTITEVISAGFIIITLTVSVSSIGIIGASVIVVIATLIKISIYLIEFNKHICKINFLQLVPKQKDFIELLYNFKKLYISVKTKALKF